MPQYRFQFQEQLSYIPPKGAHFADENAARLHAEYMASHLGAIDPAGYILVTDETGATVVRCPARKTSNLNLDRRCRHKTQSVAFAL